MLTLFTRIGFPVPTNVSMLPFESAVVNRLEFVWEGGGFLCQTPAVSNIGNDFYALICLSGSDVLAAGRGLVISLIASVEYVPYYFHRFRILN
jgi:hypothetical protein